jgi:hypothetical protein
MKRTALIGITIGIALALITNGCATRSMTGQEQIAVAKKCKARGMNVGVGYRGLLWHDLEYAYCVKPPGAINPDAFIYTYEKVFGDK